MYYLNLFFVYSILGFLFESTVVRLLSSDYQSGFVYGFWTPVYGIGVVIIILIYKFLSRYVKKEYIKTILLFLLSAVILSIIEFIGGILIENIFNKIYWNYEGFRYNIGKYISLETACIWGIGSVFIVYLINPLIDKLVVKIPKVVTYILTFLFIVDLVITFIVKL